MTGRRRRWQRRALLLLAGAALSMGCTAPDEADSGPSPDNAVPATSRFSAVQLVSQDTDGTRWTLEADQGQGWEGPGTGELKGVRGALERASGTVRLEAGRAEVEEMDVIRLSEGVTLRWDEYAARVARAEYRRGQGRVTSEDAVELEGPAVSVRGTGLDLDVAQRTARVLAGVTARIVGVGP